MQWKIIHPITVGIIHILIDIFNLGEQLGIYLVTKQDDINEESQQRFFFIMFAIGGAASFEGCCCLPVTKVIFGLLIEVGEFVCYMLLLPRTYNMVVIASVFFAIETILYLINIVLVIKEPLEDKIVLALDMCITPFRILLYGALYQIHILCLFLERSSLFRADLYEILLILNAFFGIITVNKLIGIPIKLSAAGNKYNREANPITEDMVYLVWQVILFFLNIVLGIAMMIVGLIYTSQAFRDTAALKTYDFVVYIILTVGYSSSLFALALSIIAVICLISCGVFVLSVEKIKRLLK